MNKQAFFGIFAVLVLFSLVSASAYCGDGYCTVDETSLSCPSDCANLPYCGDGVCNGNENKYVCPDDCLTQVQNTGASTCNDCALEIIPSQISVCRGDAAQAQVKLFNAYSTDRTVALRVSSTTSISSNLPSSILVPAYGEKRSSFTISLPSTIAFGTYPVTITASTQDIEDSDDLVITVRNCYDSSIRTPGSLTLCEGDSETFDVVISNTGSRDEVYALSLAGVPNGVAASIRPASLSIPAGSSATATVSFTNQASSPQSSTVVVKAQGANDYSESTIDLRLSDCHSVSTSLPASVLTCPLEGLTLDAVVRNSGIREDTYALTLGGSCSATTSLKTVTLGPGEEQPLSINLGSDYGQCTLSLTAQGIYSSSASSSAIEVRPCYGLDVEVLPSSKFLCPCEIEPYEVLVTNTGLYPQTVTLSAQGIVGIFSPETVSLQGGQQQTVVFTPGNTCCLRRTLNFNVTARSSYASAKDSASLSVEENKAICSSISLEPKRESYEIDCEDGGYFELLLRNTGFTSDSVTLTASGPGDFELQPDSVDLSYSYVGDTRPIALYVFPTDETAAQYEILVSAQGEYAESSVVLSVDLEACTISTSAPVAVDEEPDSTDTCADSSADPEINQTPTGEIIIGGYEIIAVVLVVIACVLAVFIFKSPATQEKKTSEETLKQLSEAVSAKSVKTETAKSVKTETASTKPASKPKKTPATKATKSKK